MVSGFHVVRPIATVQFWVEPYPEMTQEFGPVANTTFILSSGLVPMTRIIICQFPEDIELPRFTIGAVCIFTGVLKDIFDVFFLS